jgi:crossover junction endonuclease MUS81
MQFIIDNRERKIIENISKLIPNKYQLQNLELGDFVFEIDNIPHIIIERKTVQDLASSIKDGRYKEQKIRLLGEREKNKKLKIILLIEGNINTKTGGIPSATFHSVVINSMIRDGIFVLITKNIEETCDTLVKMYKLIEKNKSDFINSEISIPNSIDYASCLKKNKKENLTPKVCYINQLSQIPGVSTTISSRIVEKHHTMLDLIRELEIEEGDTIEELKYGSSQRKIGKVVAKRIYEYLCSPK